MKTLATKVVRGNHHGVFLQRCAEHLMIKRINTVSGWVLPPRGWRASTAVA